jgi:hypothetical protein
MFTCSKCTFSCAKKGDWNRHIATKKHIKTQDTDELRKILIKQQEQIDTQQKQINELIPKIETHRFNLNFFLNDQCKDALNWSEFVDTLILDNPDISKLICDGIYDIGIYKRPIHCIDMKRKKICIKNKNVWEHDFSKVQNTLNETTASMQVLYLKQWETSHPNWFTNENETDAYTRVVSTSHMNLCDSLTKVICIPKVES